MKTESGAKYRWLSVGDRVRYVGRAGQAGLRDRLGEVRAVPTPGVISNVIVRLDDGQWVVAPAGTWRRLAVNA
jgi:hypothetical protein